MDLKIKGNTSFNASLSIKYCSSSEKKLLKPAKELFEEMTKDKPGRMRIVPGDYARSILDGYYIFSLGAGDISKTTYRDQVAFAPYYWFDNLLTKKSKREQAEAFVKIFETLQLIPRNIGLRLSSNENYMNALKIKIQENLGDDPHEIAGMFDSLFY